MEDSNGQENEQKKKAAHIEAREGGVAHERLADGACTTIGQPIVGQIERRECRRTLERVADVASTARADGVPAQVKLAQAALCGRLAVTRKCGGDGAHAVIGDAVMLKHEALQCGRCPWLQHLLREGPHADLAHAARAEVESVQCRESGKSWQK